MWALTNQPADRIKCWKCVQSKFVCFYTFVAVRMSGNAATTGQTGSAQTGGVIRAARLCSCLPSLPWPRALADSRENRICQIRAAADEEKHRSISHTSAGQSESRPALGTKAATEQQGGVEHACAHANSREQSSPGANARPRLLPGWFRLGVRLRLAAVCTHVCVYVCVCFTFGQLSAFSLSPYVHVYMCACVSPRHVTFPSYHKTEKATTNKSLISSFLSQWHKACSNPCANTLSMGRGRKSWREQSVQPVECLSLGEMGEEEEERRGGWIDGGRGRDGLWSGLRGRNRWGEGMKRRWRGRRDEVWREGGRNLNNTRRKRQRGWKPGIKHAGDQVKQCHFFWPALRLKPWREMKCDRGLMDTHFCLPSLMPSVQTPSAV